MPVKPAIAAAISAPLKRPDHRASQHQHEGPSPRRMAYRAAGITIPRGSIAQSTVGRPVRLEPLA